MKIHAEGRGVGVLRLSEQSVSGSSHQRWGLRSQMDGLPLELYLGLPQSKFPTGNQSWIFIGRADAEAEAPILCPPDAKSPLIGKDSDVGKD